MLCTRMQYMYISLMPLTLQQVLLNGHEQLHKQHHAHEGMIFLVLTWIVFFDLWLVLCFH